MKEGFSTATPAAPASFAALFKGRYAVMTACLSLLFGLIYYLHPYLMDDLWYGMPLCRDWSDPEAVFRSFADTYMEHYGYDNGRMANFFGMLLLLLPKWVGASFFALNIYFVIAIGATLVGVWNRRWLLFALGVLAFTFALPWFDYMFVMIFAANYLTSTVFFLVVLYVFMCRPRRVGAVGAFFIGLLLGSWHEQFASVALGSMIIVALLWRSYVTRVNVALCVGLIFGLAFLLTAPGPYVRANNFEWFKGFTLITASIKFDLAFYGYMAVCAVALFTRRRRDLYAPVSVFLMLSAIASWLIWRTFYNGQRLTWLPTICSLLGLLYLAARWLRRSSGRWIKAAALAVWALIFAHLISVMPWAARYASEINAARKLLDSTPDSVTVFSYITPPALSPDYLFGKINFNGVDSWFGFFERVINPEVKQFRPDSARLMNAGDELYLYRGNLISTDTTVTREPGQSLVLDYGTKKYFTDAFPVRFTTDDGRPCVVWKVTIWPVIVNLRNLRDIYWVQDIDK